MNQLLEFKFFLVLIYIIKILIKDNLVNFIQLYYYKNTLLTNKTIIKLTKPKIIQYIRSYFECNNFKTIKYS